MAYLMLLHPKQSNRYREAIIKEEILTPHGQVHKALWKDFCLNANREDSP